MAVIFIPVPMDDPFEPSAAELLLAVEAVQVVSNEGDVPEWDREPPDWVGDIDLPDLVTGQFLVQARATGVISVMEEAAFNLAYEAAYL